MGTLFKMSNLGSPSGRVSGLVEITDCGEIKAESEEGEEGIAFLINKAS